MGLINKRGNEITKNIKKENKKGITESQLVKDFEEQWTEFYSFDMGFEVKEIEELLIREKQFKLYGEKPKYFRGLPKFSPSSADKCPLELFNELMRKPQDEVTMYPFQRRQCRNGSAMHEFIQRDLLYMEHNMDNPKFTVARVQDVFPETIGNERGSLPAWESNIKTIKAFKHNGEKFQLSGMCDGILKYGDELIGLELKSKSTTLGAVGDYKLKEPMQSHRIQQVAYSILFHKDPYEERDDKFIILYESLAKPSWTSGAEAKKDYKVFEVNVTLEDRLALLDKFAMVTKAYREKVNPCGDNTKCFFCCYKSQCPFYNKGDKQ